MGKFTLWWAGFRGAGTIVGAEVGGASEVGDAEVEGEAEVGDADVGHVDANYSEVGDALALV